MNLNFDFTKIKVTEFGLGMDRQDSRTFNRVAVDKGVQDALLEMAKETWREMQEQTGTPPEYQPAEKYASLDYVVLPLDDDLAETFKNLHTASNLPEDSKALKEMNDCFAYFARFSDSKGHRLTAVRRSTQFKGVLKKRLIGLADDTLKLLPDTVFKLDQDFDVLIDSAHVHVLHPGGLEYTAQLQDAIMAAVPKNVAKLAPQLTFVNFSSINDFALSHPRAARYLASIRSQSEARNLNKEKLKAFCTRTGVALTESAGKLCVEESQVMAFLEVLDRRRYEVDIGEDEPELYKASGRSKIE